MYNYIFQICNKISEYMNRFQTHKYESRLITRDLTILE